MVASRAFQMVTEELSAKFVPLHLSVSHLSRNDALAHMTEIAKVFYGEDKLATVWDGTYYYIQKSSQYDFSRKTYSAHKHRPLVKFMSIVLPDGYVLESLGPYQSDGKHNDAALTRHIIDTNKRLTEFLQDRDVCVVERGFRDVLDAFKAMGYEYQMPAFLEKGRNQHSVEEANDSRLVTKVRWVVEAYHGRMKKWNYFNCVIENDFIPIIGHVNRILSAAMNAFRPPLTCNSPDDRQMALSTIAKSQENRNRLFERDEHGTLSSRGK